MKHDDSIIPPRTHRWPMSRRLGFGVLAFAPLTLLVAAIASAFASGSPGVTDPTAILFYTHIGTQFLVLAFFAHILMGNPMIDRAAKVMWAIAFVVGAPFASIAFWYRHIWGERPHQERTNRHVAVHQLRV